MKPWQAARTASGRQLNISCWGSESSPGVSNSAGATYTIGNRFRSDLNYIFNLRVYFVNSTD
jgi:hypothetical protein